jgi:hypothetical protein
MKNVGLALSLVLGALVSAAGCSAQSGPPAEEDSLDSVSSALPVGSSGVGGSGGVSCSDICDGSCERVGRCVCNGTCGGGLVCASGRCIQKTCTPSCAPGSCGLSNGCGGTCACAAPNYNTSPGPNQFLFTENGQYILRSFINPAPYNGSSLRGQWSLDGYYEGVDVAALTSRCVNDITLQYQGAPLGDSNASELELFGRDPQQVLADLTALSDGQIMNGGWTTQVSQPYDLPSVVAVPYPSNFGASTTTPVTLKLASNQFWPSGSDPSTATVASEASCTNSGRGGERSGAVKAVAEYQIGLCAASVDLSSTFGDVVNGVWNKFATSGDLSNQIRKYLWAFSAPALADASNPSSVETRALLAYHFSADHAALGSDVFGLYQLDVGLSNGFLTMTSSKIRNDNNGAGYGWAIGNHLDTNLTQDLPNQFNQQAAAKQHIKNVFFGTATDCGQTAASLSSNINATTLAAAGFPSATPVQVAQAQCAFGDPSACNVPGVAAVASQWSYVPADGQCGFDLRAKRMNAMSDEIQLVWFDSRDVRDPNFAFFVFAKALGQDGSMCTAGPRQLNGPVSYSRGFANVGWGN